MLRVLHIFREMENGGVSSFVMNNYRHIDRSRVQFDFLTAVPEDGFFDDEIKSLGGKLYKTASLERMPIQHYKEVAKIVKENNYQIVHRHTGSAFGYYDLRAARAGGAKHLILHSHNPEAGRKAVHLVSKKILKLNCIKLACSRDSGEFLFGTNSNFTVFNNSIDCEKYRFRNELREKLRNEMNLRDCFVVGHIGRFEQQKNHDFLVDIFYQIKKRNQNSKLICIGDGELQSQIKEKVDNLNISGDVIFLGSIGNVDELINVFDVFCLPSLYEGFSITQIEAQTNGLKCYVSAEKIPEETNITGNVSFISLNESPEKWAEIIMGSNNQRDLNAINIVKEKKYDINSNAYELMAFYESLGVSDSN